MLRQLSAPSRIIAILVALAGVLGSAEANSGPTATPTATPLVDPPLAGEPGGSRICAGDCNGDGHVSISELVTGVAIALGRRPVSDCQSLDSNRDGALAVGELVTGVSRLLFGCDGSRPTPTRTPAGAQSVCGGSITTAPKLCNLRIAPPRVRRGGNITLSFGLSDLEGDVDTICAAIGPADEGTPALECRNAEAPGMTINEEGDVGPIQVGLPLGRYVFALQVRDRAGHVSAVLTVEFEVVNVRV